MKATAHDAYGITPPAYLQEKLDDLLLPPHPRIVVVTHRQWMEPYHSLEEGELGARLTTGCAHYPALVLWLRQIRLFLAAFRRSYDWSREPDREARQALAFRLDLLGLAGTNAKLALDALMAGYYSGCMALARHMLETWRRVAYARLSSGDIWRWYPQGLWPADVVPAPQGTMPPINRMPGRSPTRSKRTEPPATSSTCRRCGMVSRSSPTTPTRRSRVRRRPGTRTIPTAACSDRRSATCTVDAA